MFLRGRTLLALVSTALAPALAVACSSFGAAEPASTDDAAVLDSGVADGADPDARANPADAPSPTVRFCAQQPATALLCDDFEENDGGLAGGWKITAVGGTVIAADAPLRSGHAAKLTASGDNPNVQLTFDFAPAAAIAGVTLDLDMLLDTAGYDYIELCEMHLAKADAVYFGGVAKGGNRLGQHYAPFQGAAIPVDTRWHHVRVELHQASGAFNQTVTIDETVLEATTNDLSNMAAAVVQLGVLVAVATPGTPIAVLYFDNVLLRATP